MNYILKTSWGDYNNIDIVLWTMGLFLSAFSVAFGMIAAIQSSKSSNELKDITKKMHIMDTLRTDLYTNVINIIKINDDIIERLENAFYQCYKNYRLDSRNTRLSILTAEVVKESSKNEYAKLINMYLETKTWSDENFMHLFPIELIRSDKKIDEKHQINLLNYHREYIDRLIKITKEYMNVNSLK